MIKYCFWLTFICFGLACGQRTPKSNSTVQENHPTSIKADEPVDPKLLIVPGAGIGYIKLGESADSVVKALGKPTAQDAAMGAAVMTWVNGTDTTSIYTHRNMGAKDESISHVKVIRITSPLYKTSKWVHAGMSLDSIKSEYQFRKNSRGVYDDVAAGIGFEISGSRCSAIVVHAAGDSLATYLSLK
jgi:hypothetical protein